MVAPLTHEQPHLVVFATSHGGANAGKDGFTIGLLCQRIQTHLFHVTFDQHLIQMVGIKI